MRRREASSGGVARWLAYPYWRETMTPDEIINDCKPRAAVIEVPGALRDILSLR